MRKIIANEWMSLDGVIQSSGSDDDLTGGFRHGGWHLPFGDLVREVERFTQVRLVDAGVGEEVEAAEAGRQLLIEEQAPDAGLARSDGFQPGLGSLNPNGAHSSRPSTRCGGDWR